MAVLLQWVGEGSPALTQSGELAVNGAGCVTIDGSLLFAWEGSTVDGNVLYLEGIGQAEIGDEIESMGADATLPVDELVEYDPRAVSCVEEGQDEVDAVFLAPIDQ